MKNLKKLIFITSILFAFQAQAQEAGTVSVGLRGGLNVSNFGGSGVSSGNRYKAGLNFGAVGVYSVDSHWAIAVEVNYSQKGNSPAQNSYVKLNYLDIPLYVNYFFGQGGDRFRTKVFLGPYVGVLMAAKTKIGSIESDDLKPLYNPTDFGVLAGAGFHYKFSEINDNWLIFDVRYAYGLSDLAKAGTGSSNLSNRALSFNLGVTFPLNK